MEFYELRRGRYKNLTLRILPPEGRLRVSAPWFLPKFLVDRFVVDRAGWIADQRRVLAQVPVPDPDRVWVWGRSYRLRVESPGRLPRVVLDPGTQEAVLRVPATWTVSQRQKALDRWEADRVEEALGVLVPTWTRKTGLAVQKWTVKKMKSRWGSCRPDTLSLVFNSRLGSYPPECLEHVVVHELAHLVELRHNARFHALVEGWLPGSSRVRKLLKTGLPPGGSDGLDAAPDSPSRPGAETAL